MVVNIIWGWHAKILIKIVVVVSLFIIILGIFNLLIIRIVFRCCYSKIFIFKIVFWRRYSKIFVINIVLRRRYGKIFIFKIICRCRDRKIFIKIFFNYYFYFIIIINLYILIRLIFWLLINSNELIVLLRNIHYNIILQFIIKMSYWMFSESTRCVG